MRDYKYIRNHMDEYEKDLKEAEQEAVCDIPDDIKTAITLEIFERAKYVVFYQHLIKNGKMSTPKTCKLCPFLSHTFAYGTGQIVDECDLNINTYVGDMFFSECKGRPDWCPIGKEYGANTRRANSDGF